MNNNTVSPNQQIKQSPDEATKDRIKNLAVVGNAVLNNSSDISEQTNFFLAKQALLDFEKGIHDLDLDAESMRGMESLIKYLKKKIDRRLHERV